MAARHRGCGSGSGEVKGVGMGRPAGYWRWEK